MNKKRKKNYYPSKMKHPKIISNYQKILKIMTCKNTFKVYSKLRSVIFHDRHTNPGKLQLIKVINRKFLMLKFIRKKFSDTNLEFIIQDVIEMLFETIKPNENIDKEQKFDDILILNEIPNKEPLISD